LRPHVRVVKAAWTEVSLTSPAARGSSRRVNHPRQDLARHRRLDRHLRDRQKFDAPSGDTLTMDACRFRVMARRMKRAASFGSLQGRREEKWWAV